MKVNEPFECIAAHDDAIDLAKSKLTHYGLTRDMDCIVLKEGARPTRYHLQPIPRTLFLRWVDRTNDEGEKHIRAFLLSVMRIEDLRIGEGDVRTTILATKDMETAAGPLRVLADDVLEQVPPDDVYDVGSVAYHRSFLAPGRQPYYRLPRTSHLALQRKVFHDAGGTQRWVDGEGSPPEPLSPDSEQTENDSEIRPDEPGDATAQESA